MNKKNVNINRGAAVLTIVFLLLFFVLLARFVQIQVTGKVEGQVLAELAEEKWSKERTLQANRGSIYDQNGIAIAEDVTSYTVYAILDKDYPVHIKDPGEAAEKLAPHLDIPADKLEKTMSQDRFQVEFGSSGKNISHSLKEKIDALDISGIGFMRDTRRFYPNGTFASHIIGYAAKGESGSYSGAMGIEKTMDDHLKGKNGKIQYLSDRSGFKLPDPDEMMNKPENGNDVYLTIDQKIQTFLEDAMSQAYEKYEPEKLMAVVADPKTGKILAMSSRPSFDPNLRNINNFGNDIISYRFEPGSTMKVFSLAAAIEEGVFNPDEMYKSGSYKISERDWPIRDHHRGGWGTITFREGVQRSSNVAFAILANEKLGTDRLRQYITKFGLDEKTGIDLPGEAKSKIMWNYPSERISTAFGQGSTITPIQQIQAATAIANDGKMMKPYVLESVHNPNTGKTIAEKKPETAGKPISAKTAKEVRDLLETVVTAPEGTGKPYAIEGYDIAGKTGTAQIVGDNGRYMSGNGNYIYSFLGMAPTDDPELVMYVAVKQPDLEPHELGSDPTSFVFKTVMKNSLQYLNIKPEEKKEPEKKPDRYGGKLAEFAGMDAPAVMSSLKEKGIETVILGDGSKIEKQLPHAGSQVLPGEKVFLRTSGKAKMPDMTGWSLRDAMKLADLMESRPNIMGSGFVTEQNIKPGSEIREGDYLVAQLQRPDDGNSASDQESADVEDSEGEEETQDTETD
ncbi:penicillin-binding protein [Bacillus marinisedimentorum]|uniref:penicillin-binding protein n=1 Tax=Bacillus marinisedimentorum TaxID=1821260 RepID=UPI000872648C|nr:penicillin-binding protein [Bacillus marinisedimentorum]